MFGEIPNSSVPNSDTTAFCLANTNPNHICRSYSLHTDPVTACQTLYVYSRVTTERLFKIGMQCSFHFIQFTKT